MPALKSVVLPFATPKPIPPPALAIYQTHAGGLVSIDAIVPLSVATAMLRLLAKHGGKRAPVRGTL